MEDAKRYLLEGQIAGTKTGYFDVVAHPDRLFKREKNVPSMHRKKQYWGEFWELVPEDVPIIVGCDAHSLEDIEACIDEQSKSYISSLGIF